jgi:hypothetical protein
MDVSKLNRSHWFAGAAGVVMIAALFLQWYSVNGNGTDGWQSFTFTDLIVLLAAASGIAYAVLRALSAEAVPPSVVTVLAAVALLFVLFRIVSPPGEGDPSLGSGPFLAVFGGVALMYGGWLGMREEGEGFANDPERSPEHGPARSQTEI